VERLVNKKTLAGSPNSKLENSLGHSAEGQSTRCHFVVLAALQLTRFGIYFFCEVCDSTDALVCCTRCRGRSAFVNEKNTTLDRKACGTEGSNQLETAVLNIYELGDLIQKRLGNADAQQV
jgi:hypothetical protein